MFEMNEPRMPRYERHAKEIPDYPNDLNACVEFEEIIISDLTKWEFYGQWLVRLTLDNPTTTCLPATRGGIILVAHATAEQRCRAFIKTMEGK